MKPEDLKDATSLADKLGGLAEKATAGPWEQPYAGFPAIDAPGREWFITDEGGHSENDAALICALRNNLPAILAALRDVERMREALRKIAASAGERGERGTTGDGHQQAIQAARQALGGGDA